ncbi:ricin-type beta-trefoil lectin domain protein [Amycolatopsis sp. DG1A-15b]|uniref:poly(ethylene terephthalate) hydrolase family protein n=1 Tax=Amycolatopsis sp. DG1A-15b TaxID=3052846 RepID=UPI00255C0FAB|nr:ricin-type beta-trefoil lectin domain protein [Amycolatopsis sp. DG1A-15b]WIX92163.1 ricin-type beta-trefoil lectin domain protein [Amycolatopsis sp. DG1A-15b]
MFGRSRWAVALAAAAVVLGIVTPAGARPAFAADNPYQRGPDPTTASVAATRGTFATAEQTVGGGNGFAAGKIYYPADTSQGSFGAIAIVPGYTATWAAEGAWMGHWLASFGFVVIGIDTLSRNDYDTARGTQLLAALDYLTQRSSVRDRVDTQRLAVMGHSMGGGGAMSAALRRPSLWAAVGLAPFSPSQNLTTDRVPTLLLAGQNDGTVSPSSVQSLYNGVPAGVEKGYLELAGAGHGFPTSSNSVMMRRVIPWLKIFVDHDTRYSKFLCPSLADPTGISGYRSTCPLDVPGGGDPGPGDQAYSLVGAGSGKCVDVPNASQANGTALVVWTCNGGTNQRWTPTSAGELRVYNGTKCMDAGTGQPGTGVTINSCSGGNSQKWTAGPRGTITNAQAGACLDASGGGTADNTPVIVWNCTGAANQVWTRQS